MKSTDSSAHVTVRLSEYLVVVEQRRTRKWYMTSYNDVSISAQQTDYISAVGTIKVRIDTVGLFTAMFTTTITS
jgi:hypothetical protein